jgi:aldehyde dehydrogenase (NAD+)
LIDDATPPGGKAKVLIGGQVDRQNLYLPPTVILNPPRDSKMMQEEIFGPILPILTFVNFDEVYKHIKGGEKPLAIYYFG